MYFIGIDLGTSALKLLLMEESGRIQNVVSEIYPVSFPQPGWSEQNPEDWLSALRRGIPRLCASIPKKEIKGLSFGGQMHGLVILDGEDRVIRPAILWNDGRTQEETDYLNETVGKEKLSVCTANIAFAGFTAPKLLWLQKHEAENFRRIRKIMLPKDYLCYMLSGSFSTDFSDASGMLLLDVEKRQWSAEMLSICGIPAEMLPTLHESYEAVGTLRPEMATELGLSPDTIVAAGAGDNAAAAVGTGTVGDGHCNISLGTSGTIFISAKDFTVDPQNALHAFCHADGHYHLMSCILSAASCNKWWMEEILRTQNFSAEQADIRPEKLGRNAVFFLPYLMGERSPLNDPAARGAFLGMRMDTSRTDLTQAVLEGVAFALRDCCEIARSQGIDLRETTICGGGAKSPLWRKIIANVLKLRVHVPVCEEGPGMGAAMLAMVACGVYHSTEAAAEAIVKIKSTEEPDPMLMDRYDERYRLFRKLYPALRDCFREM